MKILIAGGTGFIGSEVCKKLLKQDHEVVLLTRPNSKLRPELKLPGISSLEYPYTAESEIPVSLMEEVDGIINMAGEPIFTGRWTEEKKQNIVDSRINITRQIIEAIGRCDDNKKPQVLVNASAVGYYGPQDDTIMTEDSPPGDDFLARVCVAWEKEAAKAIPLGVRTVMLRTGIVLDKGGGALAQMLPPYRFYVGGPVGSGRQYFSWIHREDMTELYVRGILDERLSGPVNASSPDPVTMKILSKNIGKVLNKPSWFPVPAFLVKLIIGESAQVVVTGQRVVPNKLLAINFEYSYPTIQEALEASLSAS